MAEPMKCPQCGSPTEDAKEHCPTCIYGTTCYLEGYGIGNADGRGPDSAALRELVRELADSLEHCWEPTCDQKDREALVARAKAVTSG
jgi:hypothetical protein